MVESGEAFTHGPSWEEDGATFRLWAPDAAEVELVLEGAGSIPMLAGDGGFHSLHVAGAMPGLLYRFRLPDGRLVPDPASRFQPFDVKGPSELIKPAAFRFEPWAGRAWEDIVLYELHVGAFTSEGTFTGAIKRLDYLARLGVTALQIMPIAAFSGARNWGYDGVYTYAPDASYGRPEAFQALVQEAHRRGIAVLLDVVYNHFGPEGNWLGLYASDFFTNRHKTPWGSAINFDGPASGAVRAFYIENALYWIEAFQLDGLRFDAVHAIKDDSEPDILTELAETLRAKVDRPVHLVLENEENEPLRLRRADGRPVHFTAQWNDDAHHVLHVAATGERHGYYSDYGDTRLLGRALAEGYAYQGEMSEHRGAARGAPSVDLPPDAFVVFLQNHDHIGNRAFGERLDRLTSPEAMKALASLYLLLPHTPMIFMGEEGAAKQPFPYFCDFSGELGKAVSNGRLKEFRKFPEFADPAIAASIPDPNAEATFLSAKIDWDGLDEERLSLYRELLALRRRFVTPLLREFKHGGDFEVVGEQAVRVIWKTDSRQLVLDANLFGERRAFPQARGETFWQIGETGAEFGPWSVRWSLA